ncbi:NADH:flavin oxidoreductase/NADH oxidase [Sanghuangporus baumii]|uniref:NADH:flavin oxidoreductase/NADH oxidase n=1 Tax=Sanghuangporus baumii TaxID=108892 RepID=A0A9Q5I4H5_SANBA|nr:NADH:flavin oxidoreductase/NADH oxidase [Sanghuangporus baumii]
MQRADAKLFRPIRVGNLNLAHRIVMSPMTRFRADGAHVPTDIIVEYYAQRGSVPLITEAAFIAARDGGYGSVPVDAVHDQGSYIYLQLWQLGRTAKPEILALPDCARNPGGPYSLVSSSDIPLPDKENACKPRPLTHEEVPEYIDLFGQAAHNAVHRAGFDGVEVHSAHGYLIEQLLQDTSNKRKDQWGGSVEGRTRFVLEVVKKVVSMAGEE